MGWEARVERSKNVQLIGTVLSHVVVFAARHTAPKAKDRALDLERFRIGDVYN
jgi:hypothetical protein